MPTLAAPVVAASSTTLAMVAWSTNGRTASCTATNSVSASSEASAFSTDCWRESPPSTRRTGLPGASRRSNSENHSMSSARKATTISPTSGEAANLRMV